MPALKKKRKTKEDKEADVTFDLGKTFDVDESKMEDFDLDLDASVYRGKKGQAGTRRKS